MDTKNGDAEMENKTMMALRDHGLVFGCEASNGRIGEESARLVTDVSKIESAARNACLEYKDAPTSASKLTGYPCSHCTKSFTNKKSLRKHERTHQKPEQSLPRPMTHKSMGKIRHQCDECDKDFSRADHLRRHSFIHSGLRPHVCPVCEKQFARKDKLSKHLTSHPLDVVRAARNAN